MINQKLYRCLMSVGKLLPESTEQIREFEKLCRKINFPDISDIDPLSVVDNTFELESKTIEGDSSNTPFEISMAARNGNEIPENLLKLMNDDRKKAENKEF